MLKCFILLALLEILYCLSFDSRKFMIEESLNISNDTHIIDNIFKIDPEDIFNVRCFWIKGWNVYDISGLERQVSDWNFTAGDDSSIYYNFCGNTHIECKNSTNMTVHSTMVGFDKENNCKRLSDDEGKFNTFKLLNPDNSSLGLSISLSTGQVCNDGAYYTTVFNISCDPLMEPGYIEIFNKEEFSLSKCANTLIGKSFETCPKVNYYIISYFLNKNFIVMGGVIIAVGLFLILFGAKFVKATLFVAGSISCLTIVSVIYFNIFTVDSTTTVWVVFGVGLAIGLALSYFLIQVTNFFFMLIGAYMGYTIGIFLYNLFLNNIHADPKVVYWLTIIACVLICAILALWLVKHIMILATSICGGYAIIRGSSLYLGHFPNESVIIDLVQHKEWDQLDASFDGLIYAYLAVWLISSVIGIVWQYKSNSEKNNDDYRKI